MATFWDNITFLIPGYPPSWSSQSFPDNSQHGNQWPNSWHFRKVTFGSVHGWTDNRRYEASQFLPILFSYFTALLRKKYLLQETKRQILHGTLPTSVIQWLSDPISANHGEHPPRGWDYLHRLNCFLTAKWAKATSNNIGYTLIFSPRPPAFLLLSCQTADE